MNTNRPRARRRAAPQPARFQVAHRVRGQRAQHGIHAAVRDVRSLGVEGAQVHMAGRGAASRRSKACMNWFASTPIQHTSVDSSGGRRSGHTPNHGRSIRMTSETRLVQQRGNGNLSNVREHITQYAPFRAPTELSSDRLTLSRSENVDLREPLVAKRVDSSRSIATI